MAIVASKQAQSRAISMLSSTSMHLVSLCTYNFACYWTGQLKETTERPETPPTPASTILPFDRDPDYVQRGSLLEEIGVKLSRPAARVALVGLGGVGYAQPDVALRDLLSS